METKKSDYWNLRKPEHVEIMNVQEADFFESPIFKGMEKTELLVLAEIGNTEHLKFIQT